MRVLSFPLTPWLLLAGGLGQPAETGSRSEIRLHGQRPSPALKVASLSIHVAPRMRQITVSFCAILDTSCRARQVPCSKTGTAQFRRTNPRGSGTCHG
jgi:hypothetical protein